MVDDACWIRIDKTPIFVIDQLSKVYWGGLISTDLIQTTYNYLQTMVVNDDYQSSEHLLGSRTSYHPVFLP